MQGAERKLMGVSPVIQGELGFGGGLLLVCLVLAVLFFVFPVFGSSGVDGVSGLCIGGSGFGEVRVVGSGVGDFDVDILSSVPVAHEILRKRRWPKPVKAPMSKMQEKPAFAVALTAGATPETALSIAGYSQNSNRALQHPDVKGAVAEMRERLQSTDQFRLEDSTGFYKELSEDAAHHTADRIKARSRMDSLLQSGCTQMSREAGAASGNKYYLRINISAYNNNGNYLFY